MKRGHGLQEFVGPGETKTVEIQWKLPAELPAMTLSDLVKSTYSMNLVVESTELELPFPVFPLPTEFTADVTSFPAVESASAMEDSDAYPKVGDSNGLSTNRRIKTKSADDSLIIDNPALFDAQAKPADAQIEAQWSVTADVLAGEGYHFYPPTSPKSAKALEAPEPENR